MWRMEWSRALAPAPAAITSTDNSQASELHGRSPGRAGSTAIQRKATQRAPVFPTLTRPGALTPPPQRGRYREGSWSPPTPFLGLLNSFAPKSCSFFFSAFFFFWVFLTIQLLPLLSLSPPLLILDFSVHLGLLPAPTP